ncbi:MAG: PD-(D/E)XK nuclease family protein, partial [Planctomycetaceae bacterium]|nr:PD-(D/E)XK nuclease family protein [Planctomycetaceae bacterium]
GLDRFAARFPARTFDVGICEQNAVGLAGGLAAAGVLPVAAIYSTFLQRGYDQVFHEVALQGRKAILALDRAGIVGSDGVSHTGAFDIAFLRTLPNMILMAPKDGPELEAMLRFAAREPGIFALRYPRDEVPPAIRGGKAPPVVLGKAEVLRRGPDAGILAYGASVYPAWCAARALRHRGIRATVVNMRFAKPLDAELVLRLHRELPFLMKRRGILLRGQVDLLWRDGEGRWTVADYKASAEPRDRRKRARYARQIAIYALALRGIAPGAAGSLLYLDGEAPAAVAVPVEGEARSLDRLLDRFAAAAARPGRPKR